MYAFCFLIKDQYLPGEFSDRDYLQMKSFINQGNCHYTILCGRVILVIHLDLGESEKEKLGKRGIKQ